MEKLNNQLIDDLNHLLTICNDGRYGYETAAKDADSSALKSVFSSYSHQREEFARLLHDEIRKAGGEADPGGGPLGALHRAWIDVKTALSSRDNKAVLGACVTGEKAAVNAYNNVLENNNLPADIRAMISQQRRDIEEALNKIEGLLETLES